MSDTPRLIEHVFPLKQASLDSVHEKNVRHGHISTLHIWPARRPLAACRAALIATLLPDPSAELKPEGMSDEEWQKEIIRCRQELCEKIGGRVVKKIECKKMPNGQVVEREREITEGGILHWGRETENKKLLDWFRQEIRKAYGGRTPKVLDPFAGGGAIPLEAMRLGCEATAVDINPVAWFILKCTLEYPQKLAGKTHPLPDFILKNTDFMREFLTKESRYGKKEAEAILERLGKAVKEGDNISLDFQSHHALNTEANLAWHVRAWAQWVLDHARRELAKYYPTYADFEPLDKRDHRPYERQPMQLVPLREDGTSDVGALNAEFSEEYVTDKCNPRWVAKPTVAYLWARTVKCKNCRATVPLLKTRWLCRKDRKRVLLTIEPDAERSGVVFGIETNVPVKGGNAAQHRQHDKQIGAGTMSRSGAKCPCCGTIMVMEDIRLEGQAGRLGATPAAVVVDGRNGKEYRLPTEHEARMAGDAENAVAKVFAEIPFGLPTEPTPKAGVGASRAFSVDGYGMRRWADLFTSRQLLALGTLLKWTRASTKELTTRGYPTDLLQGTASYLAMILDFVINRNSLLCTWTLTRETTRSTFARFALPITWDFAEASVLGPGSGGYSGAIDWIGRYIDHAVSCAANAPATQARRQSAIERADIGYDVIVTDPPYYDAIPYSDLMDFFYVWLRRTLSNLSLELNCAFGEPLAPKWNHDTNDGELIDDASRHGGDRLRSKAVYEDGMARAFSACNDALTADGTLVVVFANKQPDAWEALVSGLIRAGYVVDGSWPIQTEMGNRTRALIGAALASSVWLVCKKRPADARPGWDNQVLDEMRGNIRTKLREFWDAGIRGPDFVWAATGPALEAYSKHPIVKKANEPGPMTVSEFLTHVRRIVVDFVVGRVLAGEKEGAAELSSADRLDEPTAYYLLHRHDFGLEEAPAGACILYAISCGVSDKELADTWDLIGFTKGKSAEDEDEEASADAEDDPDAEEDSGSKVRLRTWTQRKGRSLGYEAPGGKPIPLIDRVHRLMHLWKTGDVTKVDEYLDTNGLRRHELFKRLLQSLIELSPHGSEERSLLESLSNHLQAKGAVRDDGQIEVPYGKEDGI